MKSEFSANRAQLAFYERNQWAGELGPRRAAHTRPSLLVRLARRWFA